MANTLITPTDVAEMALLILRNNWVMAGLVHKDYSKEFKHIGEDVTVRKPATLTAVEFDGDLTGQFQNVTESSITVSLDKILTVPVQVTAKELTLDVKNFKEQIVIPACDALADLVDQELCKLYKDVEWYGDTTADSTALADFTAIRKIMSDNKVPQRNRYGVLSPMTFASMLNLSEFRDLEKTGETAVLKEASMGRRFGFELYESQNIQTHSYGTNDGAGAIDLTAGYAAGVTTIHTDAWGASKTILKGSIFLINGDTQPYVVTADVTCDTDGDADLTISPALQQAVLDEAVVTLHAAATTSKENLFFHKNAFAMISAPLEPPLGGAKGASLAYGGLALQVVYDYEMSQYKNLMTISILCGFKTLQSNLACRLYDAS